MAGVGYQVREALSSDKAAVLRIHENVYGGDDYLQDYYDSWMEVSSGVKSYVYEQHGAIIGFVGSFIVDDGETAIDRAGRVRPGNTGAGVYRRLLAEVEKIIQQQGRIQRHALATVGQPSESFMRKHTRITSRVIYAFKFPIEMYTQSETIERQERIQQLPDSIPPAYLNVPYATYLFPSDRAIVSWRPFRLLDANIPLLKDIGTVFISDVQSLNDTLSGILTAGTIYTSVDGSACCHIDVFGSDLSSFDEHFKFHMRRVQAKGKQSVSLKIFTDMHVNPLTIEQLYQKLGLERISNLLQMDVYERNASLENHG